MTVHVWDAMGDLWSGDDERVGERVTDDRGRSEWVWCVRRHEPQPEQMRLIGT